MSRKCPTCEKTVYMGEKKESLGNWYHPLCLKCKKCGRQLAKGSHAEMPIIKLKSSDEEILDVDEEVAKTMLQGLGIEDFDDEPLPLPNVSGAILKKVIQWAEKHKDDPPPPDDDDENKEKRTDDIDPWDQEFFKVDLGTLFELILAANYLDLKGLLDVTCKTLANIIKGKTPEEIRKTFNIKNDFTTEEEEQVRKENEWDQGK